MNDLILLAALIEGPKHGYALKKTVGMITGHGEMHNNVVYPLLRRFVSKGWVTRRSAEGQRGQTRELYALTVKGRRALLRILSEFDEKAAASANAFRLRVGLFPLLAPAARENVLEQRTKWLTKREENLDRIAAATEVRGWGAEVIAFLRLETRREKNWIERLRRKGKATGTEV
jgi:DNA-binding PadR family transcriptional regulator